MFYVKRWDTDETLYEFEKLAIARRYAKGQGHTGEDVPGETNFAPIAYVANERGECVYNPRFSKLIGSTVGGLIDAQPPSHF